MRFAIYIERYKGGVKTGAGIEARTYKTKAAAVRAAKKLKVEYWEVKAIDE